MPKRVHQWMRLPSRVALLLGLGALSVADANAQPGAGLGEDGLRVPQQSAKALDDVRVWSEAGRIWVAEAGKPAEVLRLGDTAEAEALRRMLERDGATATAPRILRDRIILVGAGGEGFHWEASRPSDNSNKARGAVDGGSSARTQTAKADAAPPPQRSDDNAK